MKKTNSYKKYLVLGINLLFRNINSFLPNFVSNKLGILGYTEIIKRDESVQFTGFVFKTKMKMNCQGNYAVERVATSRFISSKEPFYVIEKLALKNFTMLDIGSNVGAYSIGAVGVGASKVYSIEPGPLYSRLVSNIKLNQLENKIYPLKIGLASKSGKMFWYEDLNNPGNAHLVSNIDSISFDKIPTKFGQTQIEVEVKTLDGLIEEYNFSKIDLLKIDVEGMEWEVLQAGKTFLERDLPVIIAETHRVASDMMRYDCMTPMFTYLYSIGYYSYSFENGELIKFIYPNFTLDTIFLHKNFKL